jgi:eukaryotic-like serine/threonine-protein kinase
MARSASNGSFGADGTRFGEGASSEANVPGKLGVGSVIDGKYRLERLLGEGGMGAVWAAHHLQLDLPVAIKLLRSGPDRNLLSERLKVEARAAARLVHPAIVRVFDVDTSETGEPYIVMELLEGESFSDLLDRGRLSGASAVQLLLPIADALALAHAKGILHRDIKPHNVFLERRGEGPLQPKLLDFGIAKLTSGPLPSGSLTDTGVLLGSPDYMSPEQARGETNIDYRADIWQFAVVLYEAITQETPFSGENYNALMRAIVEHEPRPLPVDENVDARLADLVTWGLAKAREARPGSIHELGRALAQWLLDRGVTEDVCGQPLEAKWISRSVQRSHSLVQLDTPAPSLASPLAVTPPRSDTLVSARLSGAAARSNVELVEPGRKRRGALALLGGGILLAGTAIAVALNGGSSTPKHAPAGTPAKATEPVAPEPTTPELAPTPPVPVASMTPEPPAAAASNSASPPSSRSSTGNKTREPRPLVPAPPAASLAKPAPSAQPTRDVHDETRGLLQAY